MSQITILQLTKWVYDNRRGTAFKDYTFDKIYMEICECVRNKTMCYVLENEKVTGICCGKILAGKRIFYVDDILSTNSEGLKKMLKYFLDMYPGYTLQGMNKLGKTIQFNNPTRLLERIS
jgi:hypothetical protein